MHETEFASDPGSARDGMIKQFIRVTEVDPRLIGMVIALGVIWIGFDIAGSLLNGVGLFMTPRNLWNLLTQTATISIMATGMVLIIVYASYRSLGRLGCRLHRRRHRVSSSLHDASFF